MELYEVMRTTFAAREYTGERVPDAVLARILEHARFAPSGGNRQAVRVIVVRDPAKQSALADLTLPTAQRYTAQTMAGETPYNPLHETRLSPDEIAAVEPAAQLTSHIRTADVLLVVCLDLGNVAALDKDLPRISMACGGSVYPLVWNILLAAHAEGYGGTMTTLSLAHEREVKSLFSIPENWAVATIVPMGKPVKQLTRLKRKPVSELAVCDNFDGVAFPPD